MGFQKNNMRSRFEKKVFFERRFSQTVALKSGFEIMYFPKKRKIFFFM
jgi:hypothetical protein